MKYFSRKNSKQTGQIRLVLCVLLVFVGSATLTLVASPPSWWGGRGVLDTGEAADDYAAVNQGQLKHLAQQASLEMQARFLGGAGTNILGLVQSWGTPGTNTDDYSAVNLGQLKNVAKPFYDRLMEFGVATNYPWVASTSAANDYALANIGQVKNLFSFELGAPPGELPDWWKNHFFPEEPEVDPEDDADGDGLSNLVEFALGLDPLSSDSDGDGLSDMLELASGSNPAAPGQPMGSVGLFVYLGGDR